MRLAPKPTFLISRVDKIGDVVLTLPLAGALKREFPDCRVIFLGRAYTKAVVELSEHVDEFWDWGQQSALRSDEIAALWRKENISAIVHVFPQSDIAKTAYRAGIPLRIGTINRIFHWPWCNKLLALSRKKSSLHEAQLNLKLLAPLCQTVDYALEEIPSLYGFSKIPYLPEIFANALSQEKVNLILHAKSKGSAREWPLEHYQALIRLLPPERFRIFITGSSEEAPDVSKLAHVGDEFDVVDLSGKMSLTELVAFVAHADGLIAASTGPLHIASALGKFALGIYPSLKPMHGGRWGPLGLHSLHMSAKEECNACRKTSLCTCMSKVTPADVAQVVLQFTKL